MQLTHGARSVLQAATVAAVSRQSRIPECCKPTTRQLSVDAEKSGIIAVCNYMLCLYPTLLVVFERLEITRYSWG
jgi:hypothetical protein